MSVNSTSSKPIKLSFWGIGSCTLFLIGFSIIAIVLVMSRLAEYKLAGLEIIVLGPFSYLLFFVGSLFALVGKHNTKDNPFSNVGLILNVLPFIFLAVTLLLAMIWA